jgi:DNA-binding CsgD family transcriptional regulator
MSASTSRSERRAIASIRRLLSLGLGDKVIVPDLLRELHALIPSYSNQFFWAGPNQELVNIYDEGDTFLPLVPLYLSEFYNTRERDVAWTFAETMRRSPNSMVMLYRERTMKVDRRTFEKHDFYNLAVRPSGIDDVVQLKISQHGHHFGLLHISRQKNDPEFTQLDLHLLEKIAPFAAHAFETSRSGDELIRSDDRGMIVATSAGVIQHMSQQASRLIAIAQYQGLLSFDGKHSRPGSVLPPELLRLGQDLLRIFEDKPAAPPVLHLRNAWAAFRFRSFLLDQTAEPPSAPLIGFTIERLEPLALKLWRSAEALPLSSREIEVCELLALGLRRCEIADRLGISENTVINHSHSVYAALGVHSRRELVDTLKTPMRLT